MKTAAILCYHKVGPFAEEGRRLSIEPERLRQHVRYFWRRGFSIVRACDLAGEWPTRSVCFTFDDAYESTMRHAPSILEEFGARGSFYAVAAKVGASSDWDGPLARPLASWDALRDARGWGHEIGNHTLDHVHLSELSPQEQQRQILEAHQVLAQNGIDSTSFCYPYGSVGDSGIPARCGYSVALSLRKGLATEESPKGELPRVVVAYSDSILMLLYKLYIRPKLP